MYKYISIIYMIYDMTIKYALAYAIIMIMEYNVRKITKMVYEISKQTNISSVAFFPNFKMIFYS